MRSKEEQPISLERKKGRILIGLKMEEAMTGPAITELQERIREIFPDPNTPVSLGAESELIQQIKNHISHTNLRQAMVISATFGKGVPKERVYVTTEGYIKLRGLTVGDVINALSELDTLRKEKNIALKNGYREAKTVLAETERTISRIDLARKAEVPVRAFERLYQEGKISLIPKHDQKIRETDPRAQSVKIRWLGDIEEAAQRLKEQFQEVQKPSFADVKRAIAHGERAPLKPLLQEEGIDFGSMGLGGVTAILQEAGLDVDAIHVRSGRDRLFTYDTSQEENIRSFVRENLDLIQADGIPPEKPITRSPAFERTPTEFSLQRVLYQARYTLGLDYTYQSLLNELKREIPDLKVEMRIHGSGRKCRYLDKKSYRKALAYLKSKQP